MPNQTASTSNNYIWNQTTFSYLEMVFYSKMEIYYDYTGYVLFLMSGISHFKHENSQELWFMHAWSETKEKEMLTFTGNIKGQCSNCALQANCLPVLAIYPYNRDEILIFCHLFAVSPVEMWRHNVPSVNSSSIKKKRNKLSLCDGNVNI